MEDSLEEEVPLVNPLKTQEDLEEVSSDRNLLNLLLEEGCSVHRINRQEEDYSDRRIRLSLNNKLLSSVPLLLRVV